MAIRTLLAVILALLCTLPALASDLSIPESTLYPYKGMIELQDDWLTGTVGVGSMGTLGWTTSGTVTILNSETNRFGIYRLDTSAVSGTQARLHFPNAASFDPALPHSLVWAVRLNTNDANTTMRFGVQNSANGNPPAHGIYFEKLDADTNWFCVTRAANVQTGTRIDSGVAVSTNFITGAYTRNSSGVQFSLDGVSVCGLLTANIPTVFITPEGFIINSAVASKTFDVDYFQLKIVGIVR